MKELDFIDIIKTKTNTNLIGDDCAYLKELGIVITQDNFVEDIHFKRNWATPYQIGYKAAAVNISDVLASGAKPAYITVGLSLPRDIDTSFIKELYRGITAGSYGAELAGGDITGGEKICISITALGNAKGRTISSRSNAQAGYAIILSGETGTSAAGFVLDCSFNCFLIVLGSKLGSVYSIFALFFKVSTYFCRASILP